MNHKNHEKHKTHIKSYIVNKPDSRLFSPISSNYRFTDYFSSAILVKYERPYFYNKRPFRKSYSTSDPDKVPERRADNLYKARSELQGLISCNVESWNCKPIFLTVTYKDNFQDIHKSNQYLKYYFKKLADFLGYRLKYTSVIEFQTRGAIHYHILLYNFKYTQNAKKIFQSFWTYGFIQLKSVKHVKNISYYVSKYLTVETGDSRLAGQKAYFSSRGLNRPIVYKNPDTIANILQNATMYLVQEKFVNSPLYGVIHYHYYKK